MRSRQSVEIRRDEGFGQILKVIQPHEHAEESAQRSGEHNDQQQRWIVRVDLAFNVARNEKWQDRRDEDAHHSQRGDEERKQHLLVNG
jgi:hypothetical protein